MRISLKSDITETAENNEFLKDFNITTMEQETDESVTIADESSHL